MKDNIYLTDHSWEGRGDITDAEIDHEGDFCFDIIDCDGCSISLWFTENDIKYVIEKMGYDVYEKEKIDE